MKETNDVRKLQMQLRIMRWRLTAMEVERDSYKSWLESILKKMGKIQGIAG